MPYYYFEAVTADGRIRKKHLKAKDKKDADKQLRVLGLRPILIETARVTKKKKQRDQFETRHIVRNRLLFVASISLVVGVAAYLILLDIGSGPSIGVPTLTRSGIISQSSSIINAKTQEERDFARQIFAIWEMSFPDSVSGIEIKGKGLMLLYLRVGKERFRRDDLRSIASTVTRAFQRRFDTSGCKVLIVHEDDTLAESEYRDGKVTAKVR
jgi:hypothetical protein